MEPAPETLAPASLGRALFISPHLDDAVFACGSLIASLAEPVVATLFAGRPPPGATLTEWDRDSGFRPGDDVIAARREEDRQALAGLAAWPLWLDFRDCQYGGGTSREEVANALHSLLMQGVPNAVFFPLGLFHSDHRLSHEAALTLLDPCTGCAWFAYEDAFYRRIPGLCEERIAHLCQAGRSVRAVDFAVAGDAAAKKRKAVTCYASQLRALSTPGRPGHADLAAAEGYWQIGRAA